MECIHPFVRIRYLYDYAGFDDGPQWPCRELAKNGYTLEKEDVSSVNARPSRVPQVSEAYHTVGGAFIPFFDNVETGKHHVAAEPMSLARTEQAR